MKHMRRLLPLLLLLAFFAQGTIHAHHASLTFDEGPHLAVGYATLRAGDLRLQPVHIHPPLANVLAAAPLLLQRDLPNPREIEGWEINSLSAVTDAVVWQYPHPRRMAMAGRIPILLIGVLLGALIFRWAREGGGWFAGAFALALYAFDPNCVAHGSLVTTDMAAVFFSVVTLYVLQSEKTAKRQSIRWVGVGVLLGLAQLAKVSALLLVPVVGVILCVASCKLQVASWRTKLAGLARRILWVFVPAGLVIWAGYGFEVGAVPGLPIPIPAATHVKVFLALREHYALGHPTFLMGRVSDQGWGWYFPAAFLLKTPLPVLLLVLSAILRGAWRLIQSRFTVHVAYLPLILFPLLYTLTSLFSTVNIGYRHLLPILPFVYIGLGTCAGRMVSRLRRHESRVISHILPVVVLGALVWLMIGTLGVAPHYLTFFNAIAGGPENGYRYLVDSNLDWGQNLWELQAWMASHGHDHVRYAHYSPARPQAYGINADFLPPDPRAVAFAPWHPAPGLYAIGATVLQGPYAPEINTYAWFRAHEPTARLGHALFVYDVPARPAPVWASVCTHPDIVASDDMIVQWLGISTLRTIRFDCEQSRVYAGDGPGITVLPSAAETSSLASRMLTARRPDSTAAYAVYRLGGTPAPENLVPIPSSDGPLRFLGYQIEQREAAPGESVTLRTFWEVEARAERPLSLMAHVVGSDGVPVAVGDGLGVPIDQWQVGDVLVQNHPLAIAPTTASGPYVVTTGAYWLETMERWRWAGAASQTLSSIDLTEIIID